MRHYSINQYNRSSSMTKRVWDEQLVQDFIEKFCEIAVKDLRRKVLKNIEAYQDVFDINILFEPPETYFSNMFSSACLYKIKKEAKEFLAKVSEYIEYEIINNGKDLFDIAEGFYWSRNGYWKGFLNGDWKYGIELDDISKDFGETSFEIEINNISGVIIRC